MPGTLWQPGHPAGHAPFCAHPFHSLTAYCAADPAEPATMRGEPGAAWRRDHQNPQENTMPRHVTYDHIRAGELHAMPRAEFAARAPGMHIPVQADWIAVTPGSTHPLGFVTDERSWMGQDAPSETTPADEDTRPYEAYDSKGRFITGTHSLRGALAAIGNRI